MPLNAYYKGAGAEVMAKMRNQYGAKKAKQVFYATANKNDLTGSIGAAHTRTGTGKALKPVSGVNNLGRGNLARGLSNTPAPKTTAKVRAPGPSDTQLRARPRKYQTTRGKRRLSFQEAYSRRTTDTSRARVLALYGRKKPPKGYGSTRTYS